MNRNQLRAWLCFVPIAIGCVGPAVAATQPNPALYALVNGVDDEETHRPLALAKLAIDVDVFGSLAEFTVTAQFANPSDETLEGTFALELPEGAAVTGYALDVEEQMIEGVLAPQPKARAEFQKRLRRGVDPGIAAMSRANVFSTHVFPIQPEKGRTIRLTFVAPVGTKGLQLPLSTEGVIDDIQLTVRAQGLKHAPKVGWPLSGPVSTETQWQSSLDTHSASLVLNERTLDGQLSIQDVVPIAAALSTLHSNGKRFFQIDDAVPLRRRLADKPDRLRVYWDRSLSRRTDDLQSEVALLEKYLREVQPKLVDIVAFNSSGIFVSTVPPSAVRSELESAVYRGATSFDVLRDVNVPSTSTCLLFSDGVSTIDRRDRFQPDCRVVAITSAAGVDRGYLDRIVGPTGGEVISMRRTTVDQAVERLLHRNPQVVDVVDDAGEKIDFAVLASGADRLSIVGQVASGRRISVAITDGKQVSTRRYVLRTANAANKDQAGALWAAHAIANLEAIDNRESASQRLSREFSIASASMAFVVFETPWDYANARIEPPKHYPAEWLEKYVEERKAADAELKQQRTDRLDEVLSGWNNLKDWWSTDFRRQQAKRERPTPYRAAPRWGGGGGGGSGSSGVGLEEIVVTATLIRQPPAPTAGFSGDGAATEIELADWNPKRPYLKALNAATDKDLRQVLRAQEKQYGDLPAFYFDTSEWFFRHNDRQAANELLLSTLDLPSCNEEANGLVADRLLRYGATDRAIWMYEKVAKTVTELPQLRRALALALAKRSETRAGLSALADLQRAVELLHEVVMTPTDSAYDGLDLIALMDANALIPRLRAMGGNADMFDRRLIALLDVDIRVVVDWNTAATDMDLWVDEPTNERAIYSNQLTAMGGRLSNDMTNGYGPEEYLLRRAKDGSFTISVDIYSNDVINPNGATVITAHLYRDFGRPSQTEEVMDVELLPAHTRSDDAEGEDEDEPEDHKLIGKFVVRGKGSAQIAAN